MRRVIKRGIRNEHLYSDGSAGTKWLSRQYQRLKEGGFLHSYRLPVPALHESKGSVVLGAEGDIRPRKSLTHTGESTI